MGETANKIHIINRDGVFWKGLLLFQRVIMAITSIMVVGLISYGAAIRYTFEKDFYGVEDIVLLVAFWMYFIGGSYGSFRKTHISAEVIPNYIRNKKAKSFVRLVVSVCTTLLCFALTFWGFLLILWNLELMPTTPALGIPVVCSQGAIFLGLLLMSFYTAVYTIEDFRSYKLTGELFSFED